jgi:hypothetical protein
MALPIDGGEYQDQQQQPYTPNWLTHCLDSGLTETTIKAAGITPISPDSLTSLGPRCQTATNSYRIPYFGLDGKASGFWRIRLHPQPEGFGRYTQPKDSGTHLYIAPPAIVDPRRWTRTDDSGHYEDLYLTEGEKKALKACQEGLLCAGLGGVQNWRKKPILNNVPDEAVKPSKNGKGWTVDLSKAGDEAEVDGASNKVAPELTKIPMKGRNVWIIFDSDPKYNGQVQEAAFFLAQWIAEKGGIPRQVVLPRTNDIHKVGLDDYMVANGHFAVQSLTDLLPKARFPHHPHPYSFVQETLDKPKEGHRTANRKATRAVLAFMDHHGERYVDESNQFYWYDHRSHEVHAFGLDASEIRSFRLRTFGDTIIRELGVGTNDTGTLNAIADQFAVQPPINRDVKPRRVVYARRSNEEEDAMYYQVTDSDIAKVTAKSVDFVQNGTDNMLFTKGSTRPLHVAEVEDAINTLRRPRNMWLDALHQFNILPMEGTRDGITYEGLNHEQTLKYLAAVFYLNPWLRHWNGLMLPFTMAVAEPNSGKTYLYNLQRGILTGDASLDNIPTDMRSWYAQLAVAPAMWICDNLGEIPRPMREPISDEIARMVTDPSPHADTRSLFTTKDITRIEVDCTFTATCIRIPFWKPDILQRSLIYHLSAIPAGRRDSTWYTRHLAQRALWVAEHLLMVQRFFQVVERNWDEGYLSGHRLVHFEQSVRWMLVAMGSSMMEAEDIAGRIQHVVQEQIASGDPAIDALRTFSTEWFAENPGTLVASLDDICEWAMTDMRGRFQHLTVFKNPGALSRFITMHAYDVQQSMQVTVRRLGHEFFLEKTSLPTPTNGTAHQGDVTDRLSNASAKRSKETDG